MTPDTIQTTLAGFEYTHDIRETPNEYRRRQFHVGWSDVTERNTTYANATLKRLTWRNLGYRLGQIFGSSSTDQIDSVYDELSRLYMSNKTATVPAAEQYAAAFRNLQGLTESQMQLLRLHYRSQEHTITAIRMAHAAGYEHHAIANSQYGRIGSMMAKELGYAPTKERLGTLVTFEHRDGEWHWIMRPQVVAALELLGWVNESFEQLPEEINSATVALYEGATVQITINAYERNTDARRLCIQEYGATCMICGFNFGVMYGDVADGYIHVHHLRPLSEIGENYKVDPIRDLRPVCPNCHAVVHRRTPPYSIEEVQSFLTNRMDRNI